MDCLLRAKMPQATRRTPSQPVPNTKQIVQGARQTLTLRGGRRLLAGPGEMKRLNANDGAGARPPLWTTPARDTLEPA